MTAQPSSADLSGQHVLVTGGTGLLGQRTVAELLVAGAQVTALVRPGYRPDIVPGCTLIEADLTSDFSGILPRVGTCDCIMHLAQAGGWRAFPDRAGSIAAVAITATARLAEYGARHGAKSFLLASSGGIYGPSAEAIRETDPVRPSAELGFYLASKAAAETLLGYFEPHMAVQRLRYFFIYGPGQTDEFLLPRLAGQIRRGETIRLAEGRGPRLNPVFVDDAARVTVAALSLTQSTAINIAGPETADLRHIVGLIGQLVDRSPVLQTDTAVPQDYVAVTAAMARLLGATGPLTGLADGLTAALAGTKMAD